MARYHARFDVRSCRGRLPSLHVDPKDFPCLKGMRKHQETETTAILSAAMAGGETCILKLHAPSVDVEV